VGREGAGFVGGTVGSVGGGLLAGWTTSLVCGPGAAICALAVTVVIVGGAATGSGMLGEAAYEALLPRPAPTAEEDSLLQCLEGP